MTTAPSTPGALGASHSPTPATRCSPSKKPAGSFAVPEGTLRYWRHLGAGPRRFKLGRHVRYWRTDLVHWLTEQTNRPQERG